MFNCNESNRLLVRVLAGLVITVILAVASLSHAVGNVHAFL